LYLVHDSAADLAEGPRDGSAHSGDVLFSLSHGVTRGWGHSNETGDTPRFLFFFSREREREKERKGEGEEEEEEGGGDDKDDSF
jgi:hypothetical protein